jgi:hypothetical protein
MIDGTEATPAIQSKPERKRFKFTPEMAKLAQAKAAHARMNRKQTAALSVQIAQQPASSIELLAQLPRENANSTKVRANLELIAVCNTERLAALKVVDWDTAKTAIDACDKLFGWSKQDAPGALIQVGYLSGLRQTPQENMREIKELSEKPVELTAQSQTVYSSQVT